MPNPRITAPNANIELEYALLCDEVLFDNPEKRGIPVGARGLFTRKYSPGFPAVLPESCTLLLRIGSVDEDTTFAVGLTKGGREVVTARVYRLARTSEEYFANVIAIGIGSKGSIVLPEPGEYEFQLWHEHRVFGRKKLWVELQPSPGGPRQTV